MTILAAPKLRFAALCFALFCFLFSYIAITINASDQNEFNLQQMGVEALVERHTFALEGSQVPQLQPRGDVYDLNGHVYAIKQPGQFVAGAVVYQMLYWLGLTYAQNFLLTAALVTLGTAGWFLFPKKFRVMGVLLGSLTVAHLVYITSIATVGHAQFGPRYLLPVLPFMTLGLIGFVQWWRMQKYRVRFVSGIIFGLASLISVIVQSIGAYVGVMYNEVSVHPVPKFLVNVLVWQDIELPLVRMGTLLFFATILCTVLFIRYTHWVTATKKSR